MQLAPDRATVDPAAIEALLPQQGQIEQMTTEDLRQALDVSRRLSAKILTVAAMVWRELERRGEDMTPYLEDIAYRRVRDIAGGKLAPEAVMKFGTRTRLLDRIANLPPAEQKKLAEGERVTVVERDPETKKLDERKLPVESLEKSQLNLLFAPSGEMRTPDQQRAVLTATPLKHPEADKPRGRVFIARGKLRTDGEVEVQAVIAALREKGFLPPLGK
ncbi:hypothetical protein [Gemmata sp.]|uniref:hypothetical protein n=1 Tax=Gemmata sp. TaxID=1914242 RepID=UPI003F72E2A5